MTFLQRLCLLLAITSLIGCVTPPPPPRPDETLTQKEVNVASALKFESSREEALLAVAKRTDLAATDQVYLIDVIYQRLTVEESKMNLLKNLIHNPAFTNAAKAAILDGLTENLKFDNDRQQILRLLQERGPIDDMDVSGTTRP